MGTSFMSIPLITFSFLFLLLPLLYSFIQWKFEKARKASNHGPISYPIIGCLISFYKNRRRLLDWYTDMLSASPTQTITVSRFGARRNIVTANPQNVEYILKTNFANFPKGKPFTEMLGDFLGNGIFNVDGDLWYKQRKLVVHQFSPKSLRDYMENVVKEDVEKKLIPLLESAADGVQGKPVDLQDLLRRLAFDLVCQNSLGFDPCCLDYHSLDTPHTIVEAFDVASDMSARRGAAPLSAQWKLRRFFDIGPEKKLREAISRIHLFIDQIINDRKKIILDCSSKIGSTESSTESDDLLTRLVLDGIENKVVRDTIISFIMAGRDTTSAAMTWLFYMFSCHPDVENKVLREIEVVEEDGENLFKYETLKELRWLRACICESMRLYPPIAWDSKHAHHKDVLPDGTRVLTGDRVTYFPYGMGRIEGLWGEDRFEFKPERWISEGEQDRIKALKNVSPYKYPIFQAGPRACLGKEMAFVQMKYVVASILKRFTIRPVVTENRPVFVPLLTAHMAGGFKVFVFPRQ